MSTTFLIHIHILIFNSFSGLLTTRQDATRISLLMMLTGFTSELPPLPINSTLEERSESTLSESTTLETRTTEPALSTTDSPPENALDTAWSSSSKLALLVSSHTRTMMVHPSSTERLLPRREPPTWTELPPRSPRSSRRSETDFSQICIR